ncbi:MAG: sugar transferase, partial [Acidimicrobiales bacterium]
MIKATRILDIAFAGALIVLAAPIAMLASLFVIMSSSGAPILLQPRIGLNGKPFKLFKLRTMIEDAEAGVGPRLASTDDERLVRGGRLLRALHIDELPQLLNVLRGEMSLVGPRPERPEFVTALSEQLDDYPRRHDVRPGLTGSAQIAGGYYMAPKLKLKHDLAYCDEPALRHYLHALISTPKAIVRDVRLA